MSRCLRCGQDNEKTARFCVGCGSQLVSEQTESPVAVAAAPGRGALTARQEHGPQQPSPVPNRPTPQDRPYTGRSSSPGLLPALIVPGSAGLGSSDEFEAARPAPSVGVPASANLAFAETAPPLLDADLHRPIRDRGARQSRVDADGSEPRMTYAPPKQADFAAPKPSEGSVDPLSVPHDAPRVLAGFLVSYESSALGQSWGVYQGSNHVGRLGAITGADVELPHATVSSRHSVIQAAAHPGRLLLRDQNSTNGSFVNDTALQPDEQRELQDGDRVRFGLFTVIVKII